MSRTEPPSRLSGPAAGYTLAMEVGGFFLLIVILVVLGAVGGGVYLIAARLRQKQLDPEGDKVEGRDTADTSRPRHLTVESEQQSDFVGSR
jgi:hypothetical protein